MKRLLAKTCRMMMITITIMLVTYGTDGLGPIEKTETRRGCCEFHPALAELGLYAIPLLQDKYPVLTLVRPG